MTDPQSDNPAPDAWRFNPRAFLAREWPYLLMLILALFGVAYTSFSKTPMTMYWIALAPFIGVIWSSHAGETPRTGSNACALSGRRRCIGARSC